MGTTYDPSSPILGMEARRFRSILSSWDRHRNPVSVASVASLGTTPAEVAAVVDEAEARGFIGNDPKRNTGNPFGLLDPGLALLNAKSRKRIDASKGWEIVQALLDNATLANRERGLPFAVRAIWLYGSLAKGSPTIDDVDVVIETGTPRHMTMEQADSLGWRMCHSMGGGSVVTYGGPLGYFQTTGWVRDRTLYGARRNQRLSVRDDVEELKAMAVPCRKVFDEVRGADLDAPLLDHHPQSRGRKAHVGEPRVLPDLAVEPPLAPAHCQAAKAIAMATIGTRRLRDMWVEVLYSEDDWIPYHLEGFVASCGKLDGRTRTVVHDRNSGGGAVLVTARVEDGALHVSTEAWSKGPPMDGEVLDEYLGAVFACTRHRAALRGEPLLAGFLDGDEVDLRDGARYGGGLGRGLR